MNLGDAEQALRIAAYLTHVQETIQEHGWMVQGVFDPSGEDHPFVYTVGLTEAGLPELLLAGMPPDQGCTVLNYAAQVHVKQEFRPGQVVEVGLNVPLKVTDPYADDQERAPVGVAHSYYRERRVQVLMLLWPDAAGRFPGEEGFDPKFEGRQEVPRASDQG